MKKIMNMTPILGKSWPSRRTSAVDDDGDEEDEEEDEEGKASSE